jgi:hypothetical protein
MPMITKDIYEQIASTTQYQHQLRLEFPNFPEWWKDWNEPFDSVKLKAWLKIKMKAWRESEGGEKFRKQFGERFSSPL